MSADELAVELRRIIARVAGIDVSELAGDEMLREELMLDSLKELEIVARTEVRFGIELDERMLGSIRTLKEYCGLVASALDTAHNRRGSGPSLPGGV